jgi:hypothetical protein
MKEAGPVMTLSLYLLPSCIISPAFGNPSFKLQGFWKELP